MAFKMKGAPIIKGTKAHHSAVKKAKTMAYKHDEYTPEQMDQLRDFAMEQGHDPKEADQMIHAGNYDLSDIQGQPGESPAKALPVVLAALGMGARYVGKKLIKKGVKKYGPKILKGIGITTATGGAVAAGDAAKKEYQEKRVDKAVKASKNDDDSPNKFIGKAARGVRKKVARTKGKIKKASGKIKGKVKQSS